MAKTQIAAQLYTLREFTKTPGDVARSMAKVRDMGYKADPMSRMGPFDMAEGH